MMASVVTRALPGFAKFWNRRRPDAALVSVRGDGLGHRRPGYAPPAEASFAGLEVISSIMVWMDRIFSSTRSSSTKG